MTKETVNDSREKQVLLHQLQKALQDDIESASDDTDEDSGININAQTIARLTRAQTEHRIQLARSIIHRRFWQCNHPPQELGREGDRRDEETRNEVQVFLFSPAMIRCLFTNG